MVLRVSFYLDYAPKFNAGIKYHVVKALADEQCHEQASLRNFAWAVTGWLVVRGYCCDRCCRKRDKYAML